MKLTKNELKNLIKECIEEFKANNKILKEDISVEQDIEKRLREAEEYLVKNVLNHSYIDVAGDGEFNKGDLYTNPSIKIETGYDITDEIVEDPNLGDFNNNVGSRVRIPDSLGDDAANWITRDIEKSDFKEKFPDLDVECYGTGVESDMQVSYVKHHNHGYYEEPETEVEFDGNAIAFVDVVISAK